MIPIDKVIKILERHDSLEKELSTGKVDPKSLAKKSKEYSDLKKMVSQAKQYIEFEKNKEDLNNIIKDKKNDKEMVSLAEKELKDVEENREKNEKILKIFLLPKDKDDEKNTIVEIRAGTGGLEATLFVSDLFRMYEKVCTKKKWVMEIISISKSEAGGFKEIIFSVTGNDVYSYMKYESGVHRVQRVPDTETQGRVHTSAATVAVLPEAEEVDIQIKDSEIRVDVFRSGGPGGQSVNTTDSAVSYSPSIRSSSKSARWKISTQNKAKALKILRASLWSWKEKRSRKIKNRKSQIGSGDRSERIRTYNFPQGRVTDHRINLTLHKLEEFLNGDIHEEMNENLRLKEQNLKLQNLTWNELYATFRNWCKNFKK